MYTIYFDSIQEGVWFQELHPLLKDADLQPFPNAVELLTKHELLQEALSFDRPDIILCDGGVPKLVVERTIEVPSGHNVGQRFARLVAAARQRIPVVYFGPYAAYKHGGATQGPRYMNLRLFYALESMGDTYETPISIINWIVDKDYEIIRDARKDQRMIAYLNLFFDLYQSVDFEKLRQKILVSKFEQEQHKEREHFITDEVKKPEQYDGPPNSVDIHTSPELNAAYPSLSRIKLPNPQSVVYNVGMKYVRSDPYTGMGLLYTYLYCGSLENKTRNLVLYFPNISLEMWKEVSSNTRRKDVRLYKMVSDAIIFSDGTLKQSNL